MIKSLFKIFFHLSPFILFHWVCFIVISTHFFPFVFWFAYFFYIFQWFNYYDNYVSHQMFCFLLQDVVWIQCNFDLLICHIYFLFFFCKVLSKMGYILVRSFKSLIQNIFCHYIVGLIFCFNFVATFVSMSWMINNFLLLDVLSFTLSYVKIILHTKATFLSLNFKSQLVKNMEISSWLFKWTWCDNFTLVSWPTHQFWHQNKCETNYITWKNDN